jgi:hypothetical protein
MAHSHAEETIRVLDDFVCEAIPGPGVATGRDGACRVDDGMRVLDESCDPVQDPPNDPGEPGVPSSEKADRALDRLLDPLSHSLSPEAARSILGLTIDPALQDRIDELADRCNEGLLSEGERAEYEGYVEGAEILALLKLKARRSLSAQGAA